MATSLFVARCQTLCVGQYSWIHEGISNIRERLRLRTFLAFQLRCRLVLPPPGSSASLSDLGPGLFISFSSLYRAGHVACIQDGASAGVAYRPAWLSRGARRDSTIHKARNKVILNDQCETSMRYTTQCGTSCDMNV